MVDSFHDEQFYILYQLGKWNDTRITQNIFIDYKSWSGIWQTLSMFANQSNLQLNEILFLTPIQYDAVELIRSGIWAEVIDEFIYENYTVDSWIQGLTKHPIDFEKVRKVRDRILYRGDNQPPIKMVVIINAEQISPKTLKDINEHLHYQTVVCYDSSLFYPEDSIVPHVKKKIKHYFLNDDVSDAQKFLYEMMEKRLVPLSKNPEVRVVEYKRTGHDLSKLNKPVITTDPERDRSKTDTKISKGDLVFAISDNWRFSLEPDKYYLHKGVYVIIDSMSRKDGILRTTSHPTYTAYRFRVVPSVQYQKVALPHLIDKLPIWRFSRGSILVNKIIRSYTDAKRIYAACNMFNKNLQFFII